MQKQSGHRKAKGGRGDVNHWAKVNHIHRLTEIQAEDQDPEH